MYINLVLKHCRLLLSYLPRLICMRESINYVCTLPIYKQFWGHQQKERIKERGDVNHTYSGWLRIWESFKLEGKQLRNVIRTRDTINRRDRRRLMWLIHTVNLLPKSFGVWGSKSSSHFLMLNELFTAFQPGTEEEWHTVSRVDNAHWWRHNESCSQNQSSAEVWTVHWGSQQSQIELGNEGRWWETKSQ